MAHGTWHMAHGTWHMAHGTMADGKAGCLSFSIFQSWEQITVVAGESLLSGGKFLLSVDALAGKARELAELQSGLVDIDGSEGRKTELFITEAAYTGGVRESY